MLYLQLGLELLVLIQRIFLIFGHHIIAQIRKQQQKPQHLRLQ